MIADGIMKHGQRVPQRRSANDAVQGIGDSRIAFALLIPSMFSPAGPSSRGAGLM